MTDSPRANISDAQREALARRIGGEVIVPGSAGYDAARKPEMARFHGVRPAAIVKCKSPADAAAAIGFARRAGLSLAIRSGGHSVAGRSSGEGVVIDVTPMCSVAVLDGTTSVGAGATLGDLYEALYTHRRTLPAGCGPSVGIAGLTLGGGIGVLGRKYGLTCDHLRRAQIVLADGSVVECDEDREPDLSWALRGAGGGTFGVVTSLVFETVPAPAMTAFHLRWSIEHLTALIESADAFGGGRRDVAPGGARCRRTQRTGVGGRVSRTCAAGAARAGPASEALMLLGAVEDDLGRPEAADRFVEAAGLARNESARIAAAIAAAEGAALDPVRAAKAIALLDALPQQDPASEIGMRMLNARLAASYSDRERFAAVAAAADLPRELSGSTTHESLLLAHLTRACLEGGGSATEVADLARRAAGTPVVEDPAWFIVMVIALCATDHHGTAEQVAQVAVERAQERGALRAYVFAMTWRARIALLTGRLSEAEELIDAAVQAGKAGSESWTLVPVSVLLETLIDQGRTADAAAAWSATGLGEYVPPHRPLTPLLQARARLRIATGEHERALADLAECTRRLGGRTAGITGLSELLHSAEAHWALENREAALEAARTAVDITRRFGAASSLGAALRIQSRLTDDEQLARESVSLLERSPTRLELARALVDLGALLRRHGDRRECREPLQNGLELAASCGARDLAAHARHELAASGARIPRRDPTRRDHLTPSEHRIATMAAEGDTNREIAQSLFLTVKTVEMHLSNAYRKLGVRSRHDLPEALAGQKSAITDDAPTNTPSRGR